MADFGFSNGPCQGGFSITPRDTNVLPKWTRAIRAKTAGDVVVVGADGAEWTAAFLAGQTRAIKAQIVRSTGTTATGLEGMY